MTSSIAPDDSPCWRERGGAEILAGEGAAVEQVPAALPMRLGLVGRRLLGDQHEILDQVRPTDCGMAISRLM